MDSMGKGLLTIYQKQKYSTKCFSVQVLQQAFSKVGIERHVEVRGWNPNPGAENLRGGPTGWVGDLFVAGCTFSLLDRWTVLSFNCWLT